MADRHASRDQRVWAKIKKDYISGGISQQKLADKYGVPYGRIRRTAAAEKWTEQRDKAVQEAGEAIRAQVAREAVSRETNVLQLTDRLLATIRAGLDDGTLICSARDARDITEALRSILDYGGRRRDQTLQEQAARIDKLRAEAAARDRNDAPQEVRVVLGGADEYAV